MLQDVVDDNDMPHRENLLIIGDLNGQILERTNLVSNQ